MLIDLVRLWCACVCQLIAALWFQFSVFCVILAPQPCVRVHVWVLRSCDDSFSMWPLRCPWQRVSGPYRARWLTLINSYCPNQWAYEKQKCACTQMYHTPRSLHLDASNCDWIGGLVITGLAWKSGAMEACLNGSRPEFTHNALNVWRSCSWRTIATFRDSTPNSDATAKGKKLLAPSLLNQNFRCGETIHQPPLYRVHLSQEFKISFVRYWFKRIGDVSKLFKHSSWY